MPRESGFVGADGAESQDKYNSVSIGGDLNISIPLVSIPGKLPIDLSLDYSSGVKLDQSATWVGLGWNLGGWSVTRSGIHGDDTRCMRYQDRQSRVYINDMFDVNIPGRTIKFINTGTQSEPIFRPLKHSNDSLYVHVECDTGGVPILHEWGDDLWWYKYEYFVLVADDGTRYVFDLALRRTAIGEPRYDYLGDLDLAEMQNSKYLPENNEWVLTAILGHDYVDGGGDELNPLDAGEQNSGAWVGLQYTDADDIYPYLQSNKTTVLKMGTRHCTNDYDPPGSYRDTTEITYLSSITTPALQVVFHLDSLDCYQTMRYWRSNATSYWDPYDIEEQFRTRTKDLALVQIEVWDRSRSERLFLATLNYEDSLTSGLKKKWHEFQSRGVSDGCSSVGQCGELTLRSVVLSSQNPYHEGSLASQKYDDGYKREYRFEYDTELDQGVLFDLCDPAEEESSRFWKYGMDKSRQYILGAGDNGYEDWFDYQLKEQSWLYGSGLVDKVWGHRDFFGYHWSHPQAWSITKLTVPEGLSYEYQYESDQFKLSNNTWSAGGCRVKSIITNPPSLQQTDYAVSDTVRLTYGKNGDGIGYPNSMPGNYWSYWVMYKDVLYFNPLRIPLSLRLLPDNVSHQVQYPMIKWDYPGRGSVEHYYITSDSTSPDPLVWMQLDTFEGSLSDYTAIYGYFRDMSPLRGQEYKSVTLSETGDTVGFVQNYYSNEVVDWVAWQQDSLNFGSPFYTGFDPVATIVGHDPVDTLLATYQVRLDSVKTMRDGVKTKTIHEYESTHARRLLHTTEENNNFRTVTTRFYAVCPLSAGGSKEEDCWEQTGNLLLNLHMISQVAKIKVFEEQEDTLKLKECTESVYSQTFPAYVTQSQEWIDLDANNEIAPYGSETLTTDYSYFDRYGNPKLVTHPDSTQTGYVTSAVGTIATFENINGQYGWAHYSGEGQETNIHIPAWENAIDSGTDHWTGCKSAKIEASGPTDTLGPFTDLGYVPTGDYVAECWVKPGAQSQFTLRLDTRVGGSIQTFTEGVVSDSGSWQFVACTLHADLGQQLNCWTSVSSNQYALVDDIRVYPLGSLVTTRTVDGLLRQRTVSNHNNLPTRAFFDPLGDLATVADHNYSPLWGSERFFKTTETNSTGYQADHPNSRHVFQCRKPGLTEDFNRYSYASPPSGYLIDDSNDLLSISGAIAFTADSANVNSYADIRIPVSEFDDGFIVFDLSEASEVGCSHATQPSGVDRSSLWFGIENSNVQGYGVAFSHDFLDPTLYLFSYNGDYSTKQVLASEDVPYTWEPNSTFTRRLMLGKMGEYLFVFLNGNCIYRIKLASGSFSAFSYIRLRFRHPHALEVCSHTAILDNLVFYNDPIVESDFIDAFGIVKQKQVFDGDSVLVSGSAHTLDRRLSAQFKPISLPISSSFGGVGPIGQQVSPFDFIDAYLYSNAARTWSPGDSLVDSCLLREYYDASETPACEGAPYDETIYASDPYRRVVQQLPAGTFRNFPISMEYGCSEDSLSGFYWPHYPATMLYRTRAENENGIASVSYIDKMGRTIANVQDSVAGGLCAYTRFYKDWQGNDTLVVQPTGTELKYQYNNLGWLLYTESSDKEIEYSFYDPMGRLRLIATPLELSMMGYRYNKYDGLGRVVEQGLMPDFGSFDRVTAFNPDKPDAANRRIIAEYEYDQGPNANGQLTKWTRYHSPGNLSDSASWGAFEYDEYGRAIHFEQFVYGVDSLVPRSYDAAYDLKGNVMRLTYSDGTYVDYEYDPAGQVRRVTDGDGFLSVEYEYWPDGSVKTKKLGDVGAGPIQTIDFAYNARGWLESINDGSIQGNDLYSLELTYDEGGYPGRDFGTPIFDTSYYNGNIASYTLAFPVAQQVTQRYAYDALDRLAGEHLDGRSGTDSKLHYRYDANGNIDSIWVPYLLPPLNTQYAYNYDYYPGTNRVSSIQNIAPDSQSLTYNSHGGVTAYTHLGLTMDYNLWQELSHQSRSGIHEVNADNLWFYYNAEGQRIAKNYQYYSPAVCDTIGTGHDTTIIVDKTILKNDKFSPTKDIFGTRGVTGGGGGEQSICTTLVSVTTGYYYFLGNMMADYTGPDTSDLKAKYVYVNGDRVARFETDSTDVMYYLKDHLGSTVGIASYAGQLRDVYRYRPFGASWYDAVQTGDMFNYTGQLKDQELNHDLYYYGARYYDPILKIFTQVDPLDSKYPGWSPYVYTLDNPIKNVDQDGRSATAAVLGGSAAAIGTAAYVGGAVTIAVIAGAVYEMQHPGSAGHTMKAAKEAFVSASLDVYNLASDVISSFTKKGRQDPRVPVKARQPHTQAEHANNNKRYDESSPKDSFKRPKLTPKGAPDASKEPKVPQYDFEKGPGPVGLPGGEGVSGAVVTDGQGGKEEDQENLGGN